jgi:preprotein translocase subunit SecB
MMAKNINNTKPIDLAVEVSDRVELADVHLMSCKSELLSFPSEKDNVHEVTGFANFNVDIEHNTIFVITHFNLHTANKNNDELAKIEAEFLLVYEVENLKGLVESNYKAFADYNGVFNAWPYWREFVNNMTARLQLPQLTLQVYRYGMELPSESKLLAEIQKKTKKKSAAKKKTKKKSASKKKAKKKSAKK